MDANQLGRRNLTNDQRSYIRGRRYNRTKRAQGGDYTSEEAKSQNATKLDTAEALAQAHGVHRATIIRDGKKAEALDKLAETSPEEAKAGQMLAEMEKNEGHILRGTKKVPRENQPQTLVENSRKL